MPFDHFLLTSHEVSLFVLLGKNRVQVGLVLGLFCLFGFFFLFLFGFLGFLFVCLFLWRSFCCCEMLQTEDPVPCLCYQNLLFVVVPLWGSILILLSMVYPKSDTHHATVLWMPSFKTFGGQVVSAP